MTTGLRLSERTRHDLTDAQWAILELLLRKGTKPGRPPKWTKRQLIDGIRWRTGWRPLAGRAHLLRAVADRLRPVPPLATRRHLASDPDRGLQARADAAGLLTCDVSVDTTIARAQQHGAGATDVLWTPLRPHGRVPCSRVHGNKVAGKESL
jgi:transposase